MAERQREGIAKAKAEGKYKGRRASLDPAEIAMLAQTMGRRRSQNILASPAARLIGCYLEHTEMGGLKASGFEPPMTAAHDI